MNADRNRSAGPRRPIGGFAVENDVAYVGALHSGLVLVDLTNPSELREINRLDSFRALGLAVGDIYSGLRILDIDGCFESNPFERFPQPARAE